MSALCDITEGRQIKVPFSYLLLNLLSQTFLTESDCQLCPLLAGNDVKDVFASARGGDQYRVVKIVIEDGKALSLSRTHSRASEKTQQPEKGRR